MKETIKCWIIANLESISVFFIFSIILRYKSFEKTMPYDIRMTTLNWCLIGALIIFGLIFSTIVAVYTYNNFSEVVSRRMIWRNSNVSMFNERLKYSINRFGGSFVCILFFLINIYMFF